MSGERNKKKEENNIKKYEQIVLGSLYILVSHIDPIEIYANTSHRCETRLKSNLLQTYCTAHTITYVVFAVVQVRMRRSCRTVLWPLSRVVFVTVYK